MSARRADTSAAVAGLFERVSATGGLAGRDDQAEATVEAPAKRHNRTSDQRARHGGPANEAVAPQVTRVRLGVELAEVETAYLRSLSRPALTGGPRTLGSKFVATGVLAAAIELIRHGAIDMHGVAAGDLPEMTARARAALIRAAHTQGAVSPAHETARKGQPKRSRHAMRSCDSSKSPRWQRLRELEHAVAPDVERLGPQ